MEEHKYEFLKENDDEDVLNTTGFEFDYINIFTAYYNKLIGKKTNIFSEIDYDHLNSTNRCMEYIYNHVSRYNNCVDEDKKDLIPYNDIQITENELFVLMINDINIYASEYLLSLIIYLSTIDWVNTNWDINIYKHD